MNSFSETYQTNSKRSPSRRAILTTALLAPFAGAGAPDPLATLQPKHPRLIATDSDVEHLRTLIDKNADCRRIHSQLTTQANRILREPPVEYQLIGPRLLDKSRRALDRVYTLALLWRLDGNEGYLSRALAELRAVCHFPDWHPPHFLDTAEMTHAVAIGYDWLYAALSSDDRALLRNAIVAFGLDPGLKLYRSGGWWTKSEFNWNQVCNGGLTAGALAIAEDEPERAREVVRSAVQSVPRALASYAPDGGWAEGPGYWDYATRYTVYLMSMLKSALGTDFGLSDAAGFDRAGHFRVYASSMTTGQTFNYADAGARLGPSACMFWLARRFEQPVYAWQQQELLRKGKPDALDLVWYQERGLSPAAAGWPEQTVFEGVSAGFARSSWIDPDAVFVAFKGGDNKANHGHLDLGTFVLDAGGVRWAMDLGPDDYNLPGYFGKERWTYYRMRTESHNTVLVEGANQSLTAKAALVDGEIDLARAYPERLSGWKRRISLRDGVVTISDRLQARMPVELLWGMVTEADVTVDGAGAELRRGGQKLVAKVESPAGARFDIVSTAAPSPQNANQGTRKLVVRLPEKVTQTDIQVTLRLA